MHRSPSFRAIVGRTARGQQSSSVPFGAVREEQMRIKHAQASAHANAVDKGFHVDGADPARLPGLLMLVVSEAAEALEDHRNGHAPGARWLSEKGKPAGIPSELADIVIRVFDIAGLYGIDLEDEIEAKMAYNKTRERKHGKVC